MVLWDIRQGSKKLAIIDGSSNRETKKRGMVCSLLLQSNGATATETMTMMTAIDGNNTDGGTGAESIERTDEVRDDGGQEPTKQMHQQSPLSSSSMTTSAPSILAGYEDGSLSIFDVRTYRYTKTQP
jgi:hypothetical protein